MVDRLGVIPQRAVVELLLALERKVDEVAALGVLIAPVPEQEVCTAVRETVQGVRKIDAPECDHDLPRVVEVDVLFEGRMETERAAFRVSQFCFEFVINRFGENQLRPAA